MSPVEVCISSGLPQGQGFWVQQTWVWQKPSWRTQTEPCVHQDPGERSSDPIRDWSRLACECPGVSSRGVGQWWPTAGLGHWVQQCLHGIFWRRLPLSSLPQHSMASGQITGREHSPAHQQKIGLKIYRAGPRPSEQAPVSPSVSLSQQELP